MTTLSNKFAHLPNGIIREIVAYAGFVLKMRNGKIMIQIPKDDPRYTQLQTIPAKTILSENRRDFFAYATLTRNENKHRHRIYIEVSQFAHKGNELLNYNFYVDDMINKTGYRNYHWCEGVNALRCKTIHFCLC
jgi:hypothetical protein